MKALSVRSHWWWFILHGGKYIENRDWPTRFRGTVCVHASRWWRTQEVIETIEDVVGMKNLHGLKLSRTEPLVPRTLKNAGGCIVGTVDIADCVKESNSPWFCGEYGFVLANPVAFMNPIPVKGALGFFEIPDALLDGVEHEAFPVGTDVPSTL